MTIRNLDKLFEAQSVAIIGASERPGSIGSVITRNVRQGGFAGTLWAVNPRYANVHGIPCFADVAALPAAPDLALIAIPFGCVPDLIGELGARGTRAAVVISAVAGHGEEAARTRARMLEAARPYTLRIVGPNCLGVMAPSIALNASFSHLPALRGKLAFVTQSGAIVTAMVDWAQARDIGFSHVVSLGDMSDVDFGDMLDYLANDAGTDAILLYMEAVTGARKFVSAARAAARMKPVIVVKGGRFPAGARAASTHTGALMGSDAVYDAVFERTGIIRVYTLQELFNAAETLTHIRKLRGEQLVIFTNGGGMAVLAADALAATSGTLATLSEATLEALDAMLPSNWSHTNPVDIIGDADPERFARAAAIVATDPQVDALLAIHCPTAVCPGEETAQALCAALGTHCAPAVLASWVGGSGAQRADEVFSEAGIPSYPTPEQAVRGFMHAVKHARGQRTLMETPDSAPDMQVPGYAGISDIIAAALACGRPWLSPADTRTVLQAYGIELVNADYVHTAREAGQAAERIGMPVALKIRSPDITHKTDVGGVVLDLVGVHATEAAADAMQANIHARLPQARLDGFSVEPMVHRKGAYELIVGMSCDAQFGPVLVFGQGGTAVEVIDDRTLALPPLNMPLARAMIAGTRIARLLAGARGLPAADIEAIALTLVQLSQLVSDCAEIAELDINPLLADKHGVIALDARIRIAPSVERGTERLAIKPYPRELEEDITLADGQRLWLRPIRPEDEPSLQRAFNKLTPEEIYLRFFAPLKMLSHTMAARFTQIDYDRQMALVLTEHGAPGSTEIYGSVTIVCDPDMQRAEYAILVPHDMARRGLGALLMQRIIDYARGRGIGEIFGEVLAHNSAMLALCKKLGFRLELHPRDQSVMTVRLRLEQNAPV